ncbi:hypothetical protein [Desulfosporosinus sp. BG]|uniref:hypothetical protein n=1 Tax=Desulfosporosinus sp. BG TaxID=1633135 RepID=UPI00083A1BA0|nr:hypothetical protein [Desulfosporosinus sp. BG]ODA39313.1 hypothetical protein DSBG_3917 [Desulfosporosinus sp. BG]
MKQRITADQLQQLTTEQQDKLKEWWKPKFSDLFAFEEYCDEHLFDAEDEENLKLFNVKIKPFSLPLLSIGQCLSLLEPCAPVLGMKYGEHSLWNLEIWIGGDHRIFTEKEPVDALFEAVKFIL